MLSTTARPEIAALSGGSGRGIFPVCLRDQASRDQDTVLIADLYDLDANFDKVYCHYVLPWDAAVALRDHTVATALCGFRWIPTREVGSELPMCKEIYAASGW